MNSRYFLNILNFRNRRNAIISIDFKVGRIEELDDVKEEIKLFF